MERRLSELEHLADSDTLTPLPNRRAFHREVARVVRAVARYGTPAAVLFVDLDGLKAINDAYGHPVGDAALVHVADVLRREVRGTDLVARIGGDEFGLLLERLDEELTSSKAQALEQAVASAPLPLGDGQLSLSVSVGVAMIGRDDTVEALLARADARMYAAKLRQRSDK